MYIGKPPSPVTKKKSLTPSASNSAHGLPEASSSPEARDGTLSSTVTDATSKNNLALEAFRTNIATIYKAMIPNVDWLIKKVSTTLILPRESKIENGNKLLQSSLLAPSDKAIILLVLAELSITADYRWLRRFVRVLKRHPSLAAIGVSLKKTYGKYTVVT